MLGGQENRRATRLPDDQETMRGRLAGRQRCVAEQILVRELGVARGSEQSPVLRVSLPFPVADLHDQPLLVPQKQGPKSSPDFGDGARIAQTARDVVGIVDPISRAGATHQDGGLELPGGRNLAPQRCVSLEHHAPPF